MQLDLLPKQKAEALAEAARELFKQFEGLLLDDKVTAINAIREALHEHSPFAPGPLTKRLDRPLIVMHNVVAFAGPIGNTQSPLASVVYPSQGVVQH